MTTKTIGVGGDYTTLQSWEDAAPADLTAAGGQIWRGEIKNATDVFSSSSGTLLTIAGSTSSNSFYKELTTAAGASFRDNANVRSNALRYNEANGCALKYTGVTSSAGVIDIQENHVRLSNLQCTTTQNGIFAGSFGYDALDIKNCIAESTHAAPVAVHGVTTAKITNTLMVARGADPYYAKALLCRLDTVLVNCTFARPSDLNRSGTEAIECITFYYSGTMTATNCLVLGFDAVFLPYGDATLVATTCKTDAAVVPSGFGAVTYGAEVKSSLDASRDFRLIVGAASIDAGTTDAGASPDISGTARPVSTSYDVGAWEGGVLNNVFAAANESDAAAALGSLSTKLLTGATSSHTAQAFGRISTLLLGRASETDLSRSVNLHMQLFKAGSTETPQSFGRLSTKLLVQAAANEVSQLMGRISTKLLGRGAELDTPQAMAAKTKGLNIALSSELARVIAEKKSMARALEVALAAALFFRKGAGKALEFTLAMPFIATIFGAGSREIVAVERERRVIRVAAEDRSIRVAPEPRAVRVAAEKRKVRVSR